MRQRRNGAKKWRNGTDGCAKQLQANVVQTANENASGRSKEGICLPEERDDGDNIVAPLPKTKATTASALWRSWIWSRMIMSRLTKTNAPHSRPPATNSTSAVLGKPNKDAAGIALETTSPSVNRINENAFRYSTGNPSPKNYNDNVEGGHTPATSTTSLTGHGTQSRSMARASYVDDKASGSEAFRLMKSEIALLQQRIASM